MSASSSATSAATSRTVSPPTSASCGSVAFSRLSATTAPAVIFRSPLEATVMLLPFNVVAAPADGNVLERDEADTGITVFIVIAAASANANIFLFLFNILPPKLLIISYICYKFVKSVIKYNTIQLSCQPDWRKWLKFPLTIKLAYLRSFKVLTDPPAHLSPHWRRLLPL